MSTPILFVFGVAFLHGFLAVYEHCRLVVLASVFCYIVAVFHLATLLCFSVYTVYDRSRCLSRSLSCRVFVPRKIYLVTPQNERPWLCKSLIYCTGSRCKSTAYVIPVVCPFCSRNLLRSTWLTFALKQCMIVPQTNKLTR